MTVRPAQPVEEGFAVLLARSAEGGIALDMQRVEAKLVETAAVSALLAGIFVEEEEESAPVHATPLAGARAVSGLDERHGGLAHALGNLEALSREEFEQLGQRFGLLPDGAVADVLNEAALEKCGEPLLDGDDPIEVNRRVLEEMLDERDDTRSACGIAMRFSSRFAPAWFLEPGSSTSRSGAPKR